MSIYGPHTVPIKIAHEDLTLSFQEYGVNFFYSRTIGQDREEKLILGKKKSVQVNPVAPLTKPKHITPYLCIHFEKPLLIDARAASTIYLKVPVDIGVFLLGRETHEMLDIISLVKAKYILYGDPRNGLKMTLLWKIKKALEEQGIEIAFPQRTVWFADKLKNAAENESKSLF